MNEAMTPGFARHLPNGITSLRILIAVVFPLVPETFHPWLIFAGLASEFLDGFVARWFGWTSYLGQVLDPIADKLFVLSISLTWIWLDKLALWQWLLLAARDFGVLFIFLALLMTGKVRKVRSVSARLPSKITTALQYLVFLVILSGTPALLTPLALVTAVVGFAATVQYVGLVRQSMR